MSLPRSLARIAPLFLALALSAAPASTVRAQDRPSAQPAPADSAGDFGRWLYPPELIMRHQQRIGLRAEQRTTITSAIQQLQAKVVELQWRMQEEAQKLSELMQQPAVAEADALAQVDRVLAIEREIKRAHLSALIRIKNALTREQQRTLDSLRE